LARQGIGLWPKKGDDPGEAKVSVLLARFGYDPEAPLEKVVTAFQRHFRALRVDGMADAETRALLAGLIALYDAKKGDAR
jgi:N-acetylmuramoyl-L-alanine amidase